VPLEHAMIFADNSCVDADSAREFVPTYPLTVGRNRKEVDRILRAMRTVLELSRLKESVRVREEQNEEKKWNRALVDGLYWLCPLWSLVYLPAIPRIAPITPKISAISPIASTT
jgi:hypothetical protein